MNKIFSFFFLALSINGFSQKVDESRIQKAYEVSLSHFLSDPIILHELDNSDMIVMNNENMFSPDSIHNLNILWVSDVSDVIDRPSKKHNGRSVITISHRQNGEDSLSVRVDQWYLSDLKKGKYSLNPIPSSNVLYQAKQNAYYFIKKGEVWEQL